MSSISNIINKAEKRLFCSVFFPYVRVDDSLIKCNYSKWKLGINSLSNALLWQKMVEYFSSYQRNKWLISEIRSYLGWSQKARRKSIKLSRQNISPYWNEGNTNFLKQNIIYINTRSI